MFFVLYVKVSSDVVGGEREEPRLVKVKKMSECEEVVEGSETIRFLCRGTEQDLIRQNSLP
jgi:hypothetical protein